MRKQDYADNDVILSKASASEGSKKSEELFRHLFFDKFKKLF
jgi:hypothetical protein